MSKKTYFQYQKDLDLPVYIAVNLADFDQGLESFLTSMKFFKMGDKDESKVLDRVKKDSLARCLNLTEATPGSFKTNSCNTRK